MRLDVALVERGLARSRNQASALIDQGSVTVNGKVITKPSTQVSFDDEILVLGQLYVARSAEKLIHALQTFGITVPEICLDVGASTGGFTQVLLERGAKTVVALDVGRNQLAEEVKQDSRVIELSGVNIRSVEPDDIPHRSNIRLTVVDLSFISLTLVAKKLVELTPQAEFVILIKPQFELQKSHLNRQGLVEREEDRRSALSSALSSLSSAGLRVLGVTASPITGSQGNREYLAHLRIGEPSNLEAMISSLG